MRFRRLDLLRFGIFTDRSLQLPRADSDLHIIVGRNEAGKSTTRAAVGDLLFGIEMQSAYNFLHTYRDMCIGAAIENGGGTLDVRRRKGTKNTLTDAAGVPVPEEKLTSLLAGADRGSFERTFSLDHGELIRGGQNILDARDNVGRMLFESASGIDGLAQLRRQLEEEAASLWTPRKKKDVVYHRAGEALKEAQARLADAAVRVPAWTQLRKALETAEEELRRVVEEFAGLETERSRLERLCRVAPLLASRTQKLAERAALGDVVLLPVDARRTLEESETQLRKLDLAIAQLESAIQSCDARASITVDEDLLAHRDAIDRIVADGNRVANCPNDILSRQGEVNELLAEVGVLARSVGWTETSLEVLRDRLPAALLRSTLESLARARVKLDGDLRNAKARHKAHAQEIKDLEEALRAAPPALMPAALAEALDRSVSLGDLAARRREQAEQQRVAAERCERELHALAPWSGTHDELAAIAIPAATELSQLNSAREATRASLQEARKSLEQDTRTLDAKEGEVAALARASQAVTAEELSEVRRQRDEAWRAIRPGFIAGNVEGTPGDRSARASVLDLSIERADATADRRSQHADENARLEQAVAARDELRRRAGNATKRVAADETALAELERRWRQLLAPIALGTADHSRVLDWLQHRERAIAAHADTVAAAAALHQLERQEESAAAALRVALAEMGRSAAELPGLGLAGLITLARRIEKDVSESVGKRTQDETRLAKLQRETAAIDSELASSKEDDDRWQTEWRNALAASGLPAQTAPETVAQATGWFRDLDQKIDEIHKIRALRIDKMQADLRSFAAAAQELARMVAPDLAGRPAAEIATALRTRLEDARQAESARRQALTEAASNHEKLAACTSERARLDAVLVPLKEAAHVASLAELRAAIERSEQTRKLDEDAGSAAARAIEAGDGLGLAQLESEEAADDRDTRQVRIDGLRHRIGEAQSRRDEATMKLSQARSALEAVAGQADAATAAEDRESALAEMRDAVERYVKVRTGARLLEWAVERYRREKQGPLLQRAGELFRTLTLGIFVRLEADEDDGRQQIVAVRSDGGCVGVEGMSTGTRDQLYLALRIAALEIQIAAATALPVIADDVLINFDDERAAAGLRVFADLACKTQVLMFTHHRHLVDVARDALGEAVSVVEL